MVVGGYSNLSNSCLKVLQVLASSKNKNGINQKEIIAETKLSIRAVKYALDKLKFRNLVLELFLMNDIRCKIYTYGGKNGNK